MASLCLRARRSLRLVPGAARVFGNSGRLAGVPVCTAWRQQVPVRCFGSQQAQPQQQQVPVFKNAAVAVHMPEEYYIGGDCLAQLPQVLERLGVKKPLFVTDKNMVQLGFVNRALGTLPEPVSSASGIFQDTIEDPTTTVLNEGVARFREGGYDCMVAVGGGSPIDTAKGIAVQLSPAYSGPLRQYKAPFQIQDGSQMPPVIAIPTTAGTGSEVTKFTVITDMETQEKMLIAGSALVPRGALVDWTLTKTLPKRIAADTAIDALTHAIEAYVSRRQNALSDGLATSAMRRIIRYLPQLFVQTNESFQFDLDLAREQLMRGATEAGLAFSHSSVALVHGMSRPMGAIFHVPHGMSNAMLLPRVTQWSIANGDREVRRRYGEVAGILLDVDPAAASSLDSLVDTLVNLNELCDVPTPQTFNIPSQKWDESRRLMAEQALASGSPNNNPVVPTIDQMIEIYGDVYSNREDRRYGIVME